MVFTEAMPRRKAQTVAIAVVIVGTILLLMLVANIAPLDRQCPWVFPKVLGCLLSARETLFAGLVAAGGALFAAWVAWTAVRDQTEFEMARDAATREDRMRMEVARAKTEMEIITIGVEQLDSFLIEFKDPGASTEWHHVGDLRRIAKNQNLPNLSHHLPAPLVATALNLTAKIRGLARRIDYIDADKNLRAADTPAAITAPLRNTYIEHDRAIKETIDECRDFRRKLIEAIAEREGIAGAQSTLSTDRG
jgi:hypothetical protein